MNSNEQTIRQLERRRKALNWQLMNSSTAEEANNIERELWALRTEIRYHKSMVKNEKLNLRTPRLGQSDRSAVDSR